MLPPDTENALIAESETIWIKYFDQDRFIAL
jgi:hypothetical protein